MGLQWAFAEGYDNGCLDDVHRLVNTHSNSTSSEEGTVLISVEMTELRISDYFVSPQKKRKTRPNFHFFVQFKFKGNSKRNQDANEGRGGGGGKVVAGCKRCVAGKGNL